jgi:hypothetical protein
MVKDDQGERFVADGGRALIAQRGLRVRRGWCGIDAQDVERASILERALLSAL